MELIIVFFIMGFTSHPVICHPSGILCLEWLQQADMQLNSNKKEFYEDLMRTIYCRRQSILWPESLD